MGSDMCPAMEEAVKIIDWFKDEVNKVTEGDLGITRALWSASNQIWAIYNEECSTASTESPSNSIQTTTDSPTSSTTTDSSMTTDNSMTSSTESTATITTESDIHV